MEDLSHWDSTAEFTPDEAAALIVGLDPADPGAALYKTIPTLKHLREGHRIARAFLVGAPITPDEFRVLRAHPSYANALVSVLFDSYPILYKEPWPGNPERPFELPRLFAGADGDFEKQRFVRAEIHRWLGVVGLTSKYRFQQAQVTVSQIEPAVLTRSANGVAAVNQRDESRVDAMRLMRDKLKAEGHADYSQRTAAHFNITTGRLRQLLGKKTSASKNAAHNAHNPFRTGSK